MPCETDSIEYLQDVPSLVTVPSVFVPTDHQAMLHNNAIVIENIARHDMETIQKMQRRFQKDITYANEAHPFWIGTETSNTLKVSDRWALHNLYEERRLVKEQQNEWLHRCMCADRTIRVYMKATPGEDLLYCGDYRIVNKTMEKDSDETLYELCETCNLSTSEEKQQTLYRKNWHFKFHLEPVSHDGWMVPELEPIVLTENETGKNGVPTCCLRV